MTDRKVVPLRPELGGTLTSERLRTIVREFMATGRDPAEAFDADELAIAREAILAAVDSLELERRGSYADAMARLDDYFRRIEESEPPTPPEGPPPSMLGGGE